MSAPKPSTKYRKYSTCWETIIQDLTALVDNMLRFVIGIYRDELNYLHEKKNDGRPF